MQTFHESIAELGRRGAKKPPPSVWDDVVLSAAVFFSVLIGAIFMVTVISATRAEQRSGMLQAPGHGVRGRVLLPPVVVPPAKLDGAAKFFGSENVVRYGGGRLEVGIFAIGAPAFTLNACKFHERVGALAKLRQVAFADPVAAVPEPILLAPVGTHFDREVARLYARLVAPGLGASVVAPACSDNGDEDDFPDHGCIV